MNKLEEKFTKAFDKAKAAGKIMPCPHCGSDNLETVYYYGLIGIHCKDCYVPSTPCYRNLEAAIKNWNANE